MEDPEIVLDLRNAEAMRVAEELRLKALEDGAKPRNPFDPPLSEEESQEKWPAELESCGYLYRFRRDEGNGWATYLSNDGREVFFQLADAWAMADKSKWGKP